MWVGHSIGDVAPRHVKIRTTGFRNYVLETNLYEGKVVISWTTSPQSAPVHRTALFKSQYIKNKKTNNQASSISNQKSLNKFVLTNCSGFLPQQSQGSGKAQALYLLDNSCCIHSCNLSCNPNLAWLQIKNFRSQVNETAPTARLAKNILNIYICTHASHNIACVSIAIQRQTDVRLRLRFDTLELGNGKVRHSIIILIYLHCTYFLY